MERPLMADETGDPTRPEDEAASPAPAAPGGMSCSQILLWIFLLGFLLPLGCSIRKDWRIAEAKEYCERLIPQIEEFRRKHGVYPGRLEDMGSLPPPPALLEKGGLIWGVGPGTDTWRFAFQTTPSGFTLGYYTYYRSTEKTWKVEEGSAQYSGS
ncbi:MAG: hypothetical protein GX442_10315 [Candidatus Riflebacteria bacterium]|nr:hypothetical protein [Candidatus Riflebacteria bacterium]